ncbi:peroxiredoxin, Ohr subfamily [Rhizobium sp. RU20A]|uniref:organic hydroperoxide resistance protein n=1 Tax=Rhizobium sp. RU20A TaxID=1907412 RepID=UPI000953A258|nr:organic hydroperoxide resistance protein [Rhizobium sp. RU20A]SIR17512.1 peroxiredoxin, Ohr subfamily [Rhizobium sp. RU20A]
MPISYRTRVLAEGGGRNGRAASDDGRFTATLAVPRALGGDGAEGTNPEQLFAAGYAACFLGALHLVAARDRNPLPDDATVTAEVGMGPRDDGAGFGLTVRLDVSLPGVDSARAERLTRAAHIVCPYSHAMRTMNEVEVNLV